MNPGRLFSEHRPQLVLAVLVAGSLLSLVMGTDSSFVHRGLSRVVSVSAYPFLKARQLSVRLGGRAYHFVADHDRVYRENTTLARDVAALRVKSALLPEVERENARLRAMLDYVRSEPRLTLHPAVVLESYKGMLRIEGGSLAGLMPSMGVITADGVVGVLIDVADFTSTVATIHHMDCRIGAMALRNRLRAYDGVVHASGGDFSHLCAMEYIDIKEEVRLGDWIVTSPESQFPAGLPIGRVSRIGGAVGLWKSAEVSPAVNPYQVDEVFVIVRGVDAAKYVAGPSGALALDESEDMPQSHSQAPRLPDMRSLQERYAP